MLFYLHRPEIQSTVKGHSKQMERKLRQNNATARMEDLYTQLENVNERITKWNIKQVTILLPALC